MSESTLHIIAYDIEDDKRRGKVHKLLGAYGQWTQYSLFECYLTRLQRVELLARLERLVNPDTDSLRLYPLCGSCVERVRVLGGTPPKEPDIFLL